MSLAEDLLNSLSDDELTVYLANRSTEPHIVINPDRTVTVPEELKHIAVERDHNIETVTFDCPRYWDSHDLSEMGVKVVYQRPDGHRDSYPVKNLRVDATDESVIHFDWTISGNVTAIRGSISFTVCAKITNAEGVIEREWHTRLNQDLIVDEGMDCSGEEVVEQNPDIIEAILVQLDELKNTGGVSDEQIANAVEAYMTKHPPTATPDSGQNVTDAVRYTAQELTPEQKAQARANIGAMNAAEVVECLEGGGAQNPNLLDGASWTENFFYANGNLSAAGEAQFYGFTKMSSMFPVAPGTRYIVEYRVPVTKTASSKANELDFGEYDVSGTWLRRNEIATDALTVTVSDDGLYEYVTYEYTPAEDVYNVRITYSTHGLDPTENITISDAENTEYRPMRILPDATGAADNLVAVTRAGRYELVPLPDSGVDMDEVVLYLEGANNLVGDIEWEPGHFYANGGETTENYEYYGYRYRTASVISVTPGMTLKYVLRVPTPRDKSTGLTTGDAKALIGFGNYGKSQNWIARTEHVQLVGIVDNGYETIKGEYIVPDDVYFLRFNISTFKEDPREIFAIYDAAAGTGGQRILPEATAADDGKVPVAVQGRYMLTTLQQNIPAAEGTSIGSKSAEFSNLMHTTGAVESFIFFTDPHLTQGSGYESQMREYLTVLRNYHTLTPTDTVICGGDWMGNSDTYEEARFKLGYIDAWMRKHFPGYHHVVGNHDTNQQGVDDTGGAWTGILPIETVRNLWNRKNGSNYYAFDGANTRFYILDSWAESTAMTAYRWAQIAWLADRLKEDKPVNAAIVLHIGYVHDADTNPVTYTFSDNVLALCEAFNGATSVTLNGVVYDFADCTGKVRFALCGHIHEDHDATVHGIPLIATTHMRDGGTPTFDLCLADYGNNILHMVRVGTGESREIAMA